MTRTADASYNDIILVAAAKVRCNVGRNQVAAPEDNLEINETAVLGVSAHRSIGTNTEI